MKPKQILILGIIFGLLVLGVLAKQFQKPAELATDEFVALDLSFEKDQVKGIEIYKGEGLREEEKVEIAKVGEGWRVSSLFGARADKKKIDELLEGIQAAKGEIRGRSPELFGDFKIRDEEAFHIRLLNGTGKEVLHLLVGLKKAGFQSIFIRKKEMAFVFLTDANLLTQIGVFGDPEEDKPGSDYWASTQMVTIDPEKVKRIETVRFEEGKGVMTSSVALETDPYDSTKSDWVLQRDEVPFPVDGGKITKFLETLNNARAQKIVNPEDKVGALESPVWRLTLWVAEEEPWVMTAGARDEATNSYPVRVSTEPVVFQLSEYYFKRFDIDDSQFFSANPLGVEADKVEKLSLKVDKKEKVFSFEEEKSEEMKTYLNGLKDFKVERLLFDIKEKSGVKSPGDAWLEIQIKDKPLALIDVTQKKDDDKEYFAVMRGNTHPFVISKTTYEKLFKDIDKLK
ncbi:MAG: DUF4340 domain-containing protein [Candidatus Omnitrophica bacterium]|nr:DUF4340 domain-containing protein [Candidatus Omnitrophota bacterium]